MVKHIPLITSRFARTTLLGVFLLAYFVPSVGFAQLETRPTTAFKSTVVAAGLNHPWSFAFLPSGEILVTERVGQLRLLAANGKVGSPVKGVPKVYSVGQGGLLDVALDPNFEQNKTIYLSYSEPEGGLAGTAVARGVLSDGELKDMKVIFRQKPKVRGGTHFGSRLVFGKDGTLFVTMGDRNVERHRAQKLDNHQGKIVRITTDGAPAPGNPFLSTPGALPEIWSYGHRNVQGALLDPETRELWTNEHGPQGGDEVNIARAGNNYGWPIVTYGEEYGGGTIGQGTEKEGMEVPLHYWVPSIAPCGFTIYTGSRLPAWRGDLIVGSLKFGFISRLKRSGSKIVSEERIAVPNEGRIRDVRMGRDGHLYAITDSPDGKLLRLEPDTTDVQLKGEK